MIVETAAGTLKLAANLKWLYTELPFLERFAAAAHSGFTAVEYASPYEFAPDELNMRLDDFGLAQVLINTPAGPAGSPTQNGAAAVRGAETEFRDGFKKALDYAVALDARIIHVMAGVRPIGVTEADAMALYGDNIAWAAAHAEPTGVRLVLEAINKRDVPGFAVPSFEVAADVAATVNRDVVGILFDVYHAQVDRGNLIERFHALKPLIGHIQVADNPGRHEPGTGEIGYTNVLRSIAAAGYDGWIGCEYRPIADTASGLAWIDELRGTAEEKEKRS